MPTSTDKHKIYPATRLGEYVILKDIAEGTFGKVRMAQHVVTGHKVAMKFISKQVIHATRTRTRVQREVDYMRALRHPHIIKLYEVISTPTDIIIVLEYAGGELFNFIVHHGKMPEPRARKFFQQLISGIEYSHGLKIVHRDLKPENVLLDDDLNVKIADFGLSNQIQDGDFLKTSCGSPNYAAPEVIRGGLYTGPEIDVWSAGVILYVMICGRLPFEDDDVQTLFRKISEGIYHVPSYMSADARNLIAGMLQVDPVKRSTIEEVVQHPFYTKDLPRYLTPLPTRGGVAVLGTLQSLALPPKQLDFEIIDGLGRIEEDVIDELADRMDGIERQDIWDALRRDDGVQGNAVKVAYLLLRDKRRLGQDLASFEEAERDAQIALLDPRNAVSPNALSPTGANDLKSNPFESQFRDGFEEDEVPSDEEEDDGNGLDFSTPPLANEEVNTFAVLNSSLPEHGPEQHHLTSYASARRAGGTPTTGTKKEKQNRTKWHFGIRSRSPPMEVMQEIYRVLKLEGMEWREKRDLGGLGGIYKERPPQPPANGRIVERAKELDDAVDMKKAASIYFVETRGRVGDVVVLMNIQLYMVDSINYLVDFQHKTSYKASMEPDAGRFDMAIPDFISETGSDGGHVEINEDDIVSPFVFMDLACRLILDLAGGPE